ncbi:MAG: hypothetical protein N4A41_06780 [Crocinitomicaceae bacterium]|jgi:hypothetical protein|nr:hypothetical protein [Crocinitomicaceae bacterium]
MTKKHRTLLIVILLIHSFNPIIRGHGIAFEFMFEWVAVFGGLEGLNSSLFLWLIFLFFVKLNLLVLMVKPRILNTVKHLDKISLIFLLIGTSFLSNNGLFFPGLILLYILAIAYFIMKNKAERSRT